LLKTGRRPGLYAGRRSSSGLSAFFSSCWASNQRVLGCKDIKRSWGLKDGIAIGGIYKPGKPRSLCMHCLKEIVVSAIEYNDTMFAVALHVGIVIAAFQAGQLVAGMESKNVGPCGELNDIPLKHPFIPQ